MLSFHMVQDFPALRKPLPQDVFPVLPFSLSITISRLKDCPSMLSSNRIIASDQTSGVRIDLIKQGTLCKAFCPHLFPAAQILDGKHLC